MRTLLAVDGSDNSYEALRALAHLARADEVMLLHVLDIPKPAYPKMVPEVANEIYAAVEQAMRVDGESLIERITSLLPMNIGPVTARMEIGSPAEVIANVAQERKTDLIVMGARGLGPVQERLFGSVSHRVLTMVPCAKFIVKEPLRALKKALLPLQSPYDAAAAVRFLERQPFHEPVELKLLTVLSMTRPPWPVSDSAAGQLEERALQSARDFIEEVAGRLQALGYQAKGTALLGAPVGTIVKEVEKVRPDLILTGSHGRTGVTRFVLGSVSHALLHQAHCPVLVFQ